MDKPRVFLVFDQPFHVRTEKWMAGVTKLEVYITINKIIDKNLRIKFPFPDIMKKACKYFKKDP